MNVKVKVKELAILAAVARAVPAEAQSGPPCPTLKFGPCLVQMQSCSSSTSMIATFNTPATAPPPLFKSRLRGGDMRNLGDVIHYEEGSYELPRDEIVKAIEDAIDGDEENFLLNIISNPQLLHIKRDDMTVSTEDLKTHQFTIKNAFLEELPGVKYEVNCPASEDGNTCIVHEQMAQQDEAGSDLVTCFTAESIISKEDIPAECSDENYDVALYALTGPHFILAATKSLDLSSVNANCPESLAFSTMDGGQSGNKQIVSPNLEEFNDLPKHALGVATLADVLKAEGNAEAIDDKSFDLATNNCVTYASSIWRHLEFDETEDLANFLVDNIIIDEAQLEKLASKLGGRRLLKAMSNEGYEEFVKNVVYSQLYLN